MSRSNNRSFKIPAVGTGLTVTILAALINKYIKNAYKASAYNDYDLNSAMKMTEPMAALPGTDEHISNEAEKMIMDNFPSVMVEETGVSYPVTGSLTIGRYAFNDIAFANDNSVSRIHCRIFMERGRYYIVDCNAKHVAQVNGNPVVRLDDLRPNQILSVELRDGDEIDICGHKLIFNVPDNSDEEIMDDISSVGVSATI